MKKTIFPIVLLAVLLSNFACKRTNKIDPLTPGVAPYGALRVHVMGPSDMPGADLTKADPDFPDLYAVAGAEVVLVDSQGSLGEILGAPEKARAITDAEGDALFRELQGGTEVTVRVNVSDGSCERIDRKVPITMNATMACQVGTVGVNHSALTGTVDILEHPKVFPIGGHLHFDWLVNNPTSATANVEWRVVSSNNHSIVYRFGTSSVGAGEDLVVEGILLDLASLPPTNSSGNSSYKILCVANGVVIGSDNFVILGVAPEFRIVYTCRSGADPSEIYTMNPDGTHRTRLTNDAVADSHPAWSPDRTRIAFNRVASGMYEDIFVMNSDGSGMTNLTPDSPDFDRNPSWSPGDGRIAFFSIRGGGASDLYAMNADGSGVVNLTNDIWASQEPRWSPDGTRIAFTDNRGAGGEYNIYIMNADGTGVVQLTDNPGSQDYGPDWSPDGQRIVFCTWTTNREVQIINADGTGQVNLTNHAAQDDWPKWSPDGSRILFATNRDGNYELYTMAPDGSDLRNLTNSPEEELWADW